MSADSETLNTLTCRLDPLTQTLFSARLIAEVLPRIWQQNPLVAESCLNELCQITRDALSEMNALLNEMQGAVREQGTIHTRINEEA